MSDLKQFTFFESYYRALKKLPYEEAGKILIILGDFFFDDREIPELDGMAGMALELIRPNISNTKAKALAGSKGGKSKTQAKLKQKPSKTQAKLKQNASNKEKEKEKDKDKDKGKGVEEILPPIIPPAKKTMSQIVKDRHLVPELESKILEWLKYKTERKESYKETGLNSLISEIQNNVKRYGLDPVLDCITTSMSRNYTGIIFELIQQDKKNPKDNVTPFNPTEYLLQQIREEESANG